MEYRITDERDEVPPDEVTATDLLRSVEEEAIHSQAQTVTKNTPNMMFREPEETSAAAALQLIDAFRASAVNFHCPNAAERMSVWRYI